MPEPNNRHVLLAQARIGLPKAVDSSSLPGEISLPSIEQKSPIRPEVKTEPAVAKDAERSSAVEKGRKWGGALEHQVRAQELGLNCAMIDQTLSVLSPQSVATVQQELKGKNIVAGDGSYSILSERLSNAGTLLGVKLGEQHSQLRTNINHSVASAQNAALREQGCEDEKEVWGGHWYSRADVNGYFDANHWVGSESKWESYNDQIESAQESKKAYTCLADKLREGALDSVEELSQAVKLNRELRTIRDPYASQLKTEELNSHVLGAYNKTNVVSAEAQRLFEQAESSKELAEQSYINGENSLDRSESYLRFVGEDLPMIAATCAVANPEIGLATTMARFRTAASISAKISTLANYGRVPLAYGGWCASYNGSQAVARSYYQGVPLYESLQEGGKDASYQYGKGLIYLTTAKLASAGGALAGNATKAESMNPLFSKWGLSQPRNLFRRFPHFATMEATRSSGTVGLVSHLGSAFPVYLWDVGWDKRDYDPGKFLFEDVLINGAFAYIGGRVAGKSTQLQRHVAENVLTNNPVKNRLLTWGTWLTTEGVESTVDIGSRGLLARAVKEKEDANGVIIGGQLLTKDEWTNIVFQSVMSRIPSSAASAHSLNLGYRAQAWRQQAEAEGQVLGRQFVADNGANFSFREAIHLDNVHGEKTPSPRGGEHVVLNRGWGSFGEVEQRRIADPSVRMEMLQHCVFSVHGNPQSYENGHLQNKIEAIIAQVPGNVGKEFGKSCKTALDLLSIRGRVYQYEATRPGVDANALYLRNAEQFLARATTKRVQRSPLVRSKDFVDPMRPNAAGTRKSEAGESPMQIPHPEGPFARSVPRALAWPINGIAEVVDTSLLPAAVFYSPTGLLPLLVVARPLLSSVGLASTGPLSPEHLIGRGADVLSAITGLRSSPGAMSRLGSVWENFKTDVTYGRLVRGSSKSWTGNYIEGSSAYILADLVEAEVIRDRGLICESNLNSRLASLPANDPRRPDLEQQLTQVHQMNERMQSDGIQHYRSMLDGAEKGSALGRFARLIGSVASPAERVAPNIVDKVRDKLPSRPDNVTNPEGSHTVYHLLRQNLREAYEGGQLCNPDSLRETFVRTLRSAVNSGEENSVQQFANLMATLKRDMDPATVQPIEQELLQQINLRIAGSYDQEELTLLRQKRQLVEEGQTAGIKGDPDSKSVADVFRDWTVDEIGRQLTRPSPEHLGQSNPDKVFRDDLATLYDICLKRVQQRDETLKRLAGNPGLQPDRLQAVQAYRGLEERIAGALLQGGDALEPVRRLLNAGSLGNVIGNDRAAKILIDIRKQAELLLAQKDGDFAEYLKDSKGVGYGSEVEKLARAVPSEGWFAKRFAMKELKDYVTREVFPRAKANSAQLKRLLGSGSGSISELEKSLNLNNQSPGGSVYRFLPRAPGSGGDPVAGSGPQAPLGPGGPPLPPPPQSPNSGGESRGLTRSAVPPQGEPSLSYPPLPKKADENSGRVSIEGYNSPLLRLAGRKADSASEEITGEVFNEQ